MYDTASSHAASSQLLYLTQFTATVHEVHKTMHWNVFDIVK